MSSTSSSGSETKPRKAGVATDDEMDAFLKKHGLENIVVVDSRNPDFTVEPGDQRWGKDSIAPIEGTGTNEYRPRTANVVFDRASKTMPLDVLKKHIESLGGDVDSWKDVPIITHCGGGGRGEKSRVYLKSQGFSNVINGGGPSVADLWHKYGEC